METINQNTSTQQKQITTTKNPKHKTNNKNKYANNHRTNITRTSKIKINNKNKTIRGEERKGT